MNQPHRRGEGDGLRIAARCPKATASPRPRPSSAPRSTSRPSRPAVTPWTHVPTSTRWAAFSTKSLRANPLSSAIRRWRWDVPTRPRAARAAVWKVRGHLAGAGRRDSQSAGQEPRQPLPDSCRHAHRSGPRAQRRTARGTKVLTDAERTSLMSAGAAHRSSQPIEVPPRQTGYDARTSLRPSVGAAVAHRSRGAGRCG